VGFRQTTCKGLNAWYYHIAYIVCTAMVEKIFTTNPRIQSQFVYGNARNTCTHIAHAASALSFVDVADFLIFPPWDPDDERVGLSMLGAGDLDRAPRPPFGLVQFF
jgi:hypothetical protein